MSEFDNKNGRDGKDAFEVDSVPVEKAQEKTWSDPAQPNQPVQQPYQSGQPVQPQAQPYQQGRPVQPGQQPYYQPQSNYHSSVQPAQPNQASPYYRPAEPSVTGTQNSSYYPGTGGGEPPQDEPKKRSRTFRVMAGVVCVCVVVALSGIVYALSGGSDDNGLAGADDATTNADGTSEGLSINDSPQAADAVGDELTTVGVVKKVKDACVGITVKNGGNDFFSSSGTTTSEGSGILMREDTEKGLTYVVTCAHVISDANSTYLVSLNDGTEYEAQLVGYDSQTDVGVLSINATGLTIAEFGDSDSLQQGQTVIAIGNPGGSAYANSVTQGVVSAIDRPISSTIGYSTKCIQHDAAINPGNSGGPLFNSYGQVVGINSSKIASSEYEGMGFAVPSNTVQNIVNSLIANGYVEGRAQIGIQYTPISSYQQYAQLIQAGVPEGAVVIVSINEDSALRSTEVKQYDIITSMDGQELTDSDMVTSLLSEMSPGDNVELGIARVGDNNEISTFTVTITLQEATN
ncbi:MAG: trypsin-like peptidase domain-containing protein [Clostridiales bacterium]|nr:trypsin-like peptidase domain-containing protein [Clostridiales bacterium]